MGRADFYKDGDWNAICDKCGKKHKASKLKKEWTGLLVCTSCFEIRHPQDFVRDVKDSPSVPFRANESTDIFVPNAQTLIIPPSIF
jgi:ribosome-binding protein aMBF1 (putative translation factor)